MIEEDELEFFDGKILTYKFWPYAISDEDAADWFAKRGTGPAPDDRGEE